jgi:ribonucleoside-diphosphate reductase alpha subunit
MPVSETQTQPLPAQGADGNNTQQQRQKGASFVIKRDGRREEVQWDKITKRIRALSDGLEVNPVRLTQRVINNMTQDNMHVCEIDELAAQDAAFMMREHIDYLTLSGRLLVSNLHKETSNSFSETMEIVNYQTLQVPAQKDNEDHFLCKKFMTVVRKYANLLDSNINHNADYKLDYFGMCTLLSSYLNHVPDSTTKVPRIVERPQYMWMRVAVYLNLDDIQQALRSYHAFSNLLYTHASPTLFNAGKPKSQLASCYLLQIPQDSLSSIYDTLKECALISQHAGGIGLAVSRIRATGSLIKTSGGLADGLVPMLRVFNNTARYVNQGGRRKGAFAIYLEPWHADILKFLDLKKNRGEEEKRCRDLFYGLWVPDLFMKRVQENGKWTLFSPDKTPDLPDLYGEEFDRRYVEYENTPGMAVTDIPARKVWEHILESQTETGTPYILYKDACNRKSNQKNLGTMLCSNLCAEILQYTSENEISICNLASVCLPMFIENGQFIHEKLWDTVFLMVQNLNRVIDMNFYPVEKARYSNMKHRPMAIGVQGFADVLNQLLYIFGSPEAKHLNSEIFATIYHAACSSSVEEAKKHGPYETFQGSPASQGILQFDLWGKTPSSRYDWDKLKQEIKQYGLRNSLLTGLMPTAGSSQIMGFSETTEPYTTNLYVRRTQAGEYLVVNKHLAKWLTDKQLWTNDVINQIVAGRGSVQNIDCIPDHIKQVFLTAFEVRPRVIMDMAADRGMYICQTQSMNLFFESADPGLLTTAHMYAWSIGLKTGMYYLRTRPAANAIQFTLDPRKTKRKAAKDTKTPKPLKDIKSVREPKPSTSHKTPVSTPDTTPSTQGSFLVSSAGASLHSNSGFSVQPTRQVESVPAPSPPSSPISRDEIYTVDLARQVSLPQPEVTPTPPPVPIAPQTPAPAPNRSRKFVCNESVCTSCGS